MDSPNRFQGSRNNSKYRRCGLSSQDVIATIQDPMLRMSDVRGSELLASQLILRPEDHYLADLFGCVVDDRRSQAMLSADPFWPNYPSADQLPPTLPGRIPIAALPTGGVLSLGIEDILKNVLICGPTGGGKTSTIKSIIAAILESAP